MTRKNTQNVVKIHITNVKKEITVKFKVKAKDCKLTIRIKTSFGKKIDENIMENFARSYLRGFFRPQTVKKRFAEYSGPVGVTLFEYLKEPISKRDFFFVIEHMVMAAQKLQMNQMALNGLILNVHNVYINKITKEVQFLYLPIVGGAEVPNFREFVETVLYSARPVLPEDVEAISRFAYFLNGLKFFDFSAIEKFIAHEDISVVNTIKKNNAGQSGFMTDKPQHYYEHYQQGAGDDEATDLLTDDEATGLLDETEATGLLESEDTGILVEAQNTKYDEFERINYPLLTRKLTGETIRINKPVFRIGKEQSYVDYFVSCNDAVSRNHADIITRGSKYFVVDLNSKNHTYVDGQILAAQRETEIRNGVNIKFANEEFIFSCDE